MCEYSISEWCSTAQTPSKPISSANTACSTQLRIAWRSTSGVPNSTWASKIIENFIARNVPLDGWARTVRQPVRWPVHAAAPVPRRRDHRDLQHRAGARARGRGLDVDRVQGRARCAGRRRSRHPRRRRRRRAVRQRLRVPGAAVARVGHVVVVGHPRHPPGGDRDRRRDGHQGARARGHRGRVRRPRRRPRRGPGRAASSWRRSGCSPRRSSRSSRASAHAPLRHQARRARHGGRGDPQQRARAPRRDLPRPRPVHAAGHPRQPHGRRPVPPPRLRHRVRGRLRARADPRRPRGRRCRARRSTSSGATATAAAPRTRTRRRGSWAATAAPTG